MPLMIHLIDGIVLNFDRLVGYEVIEPATLYKYNERIYTFDPRVDERDIPADDVEEFESILVNVYYTGNFGTEQNMVGVSRMTLADEEAISFLHRIETSAHINTVFA